MVAGVKYIYEYASGDGTTKWTVAVHEMSWEDYIAILDIVEEQILAPSASEQIPSKKSFS